MNMYVYINELIYMISFPWWSFNVRRQSPRSLKAVNYSFGTFKPRISFVARVSSIVWCYPTVWTLLSNGLEETFLLISMLILATGAYLCGCCARVWGTLANPNPCSKGSLELGLGSFTVRARWLGLGWHWMSILCWMRGGYVVTVSFVDEIPMFDYCYCYGCSRQW